MQSFIVIVSPSFGGAEKRFFDIFTALRRSGDDVRMIAPEMLMHDLRRDHPDRGDVLDEVIALPLARWTRLGFVLALRRLLRTLPRGAHFHYPLNCLWFLHRLRGDRVTMTVADCTRVPGLRGGTYTALLTWIAFFFAARIDVLSPAILERMQHYWRAPAMSLTPGGTFLVPPPERPVAKRPEVVFLGRLVGGKGLEDWLDVLPELWQFLCGRAPEGFGFRIAGYGALEGLAARRCATLAAQGVPVEFIGYASAEGLMQRSAVVVSMQEPTNYPSRVVAEALVGGCGVIVRDTGDSRQFGELPGLLYCRATLDGRELSAQLLEHLGRVLPTPGDSQRISVAARERFASPVYVDYYRTLFGCTPRGTP